jgi:1,2-diacylglycerol 3-alpha-glucosyltransferase
MRIAFFTDTYSPQINGVVTSILTFVQELEAMGHEVWIIGPQMENTTESTYKVRRLRSMAFPFQKEYRMISPLSRNLKDFKDLNIDVIHAQTPFFMGYLAQYLGWWHSIPVIHTYHTFWEEYLHYFPPLPKRVNLAISHFLFSKQFCNRCDHIVVPSQQIYDKLKEYEVKKPLSLIPTGIQVKTGPSEEEKQVFKQRMGLKENRRYLVFVGRLGREKNIGFLIEAFGKIANVQEDVDLVLAGDGPEKEALKAAITEKGLTDRCHFPGYISHTDVFLLYACCDVVVFASKTETQGLSLLEGLSMGKPAVCVKAMGIQDVLHQEKGGFLVNENTTEFADACLKLLNNAALYAEKAAQAKQRAHDFSSSEMAKKLIDVYQSVIEK